MEDQILYRPPVEPGSQTSPDQTSIEEKAHGTAASGRSFGRSASMRFWRRLRRWEARAGGHSTATEFAGETLVVPKSFDAPSSDMGEVESRIRAALSAGELRGPDGRLTRWGCPRLRSSGASSFTRGGSVSNRARGPLARSTSAAG